MSVSSQDPGVQKHCHDFEKKYQKSLRRNIHTVIVEVGYRLKDAETISLYAKLLESLDESGAPTKSLITGHIKKVTFFAGSQSTISAVPRQPGLWASDFSFTDFKSVQMEVRLRGKEHNFTVPVVEKEGKQVEKIHFDALKTQFKRMNDLFPDIDRSEEHGSYVNETKDEWLSPICVVECDEESRPGYETKKAHEFEDDPGTLRLKVKAMAEIIKASKNVCAYTGAGISTSAGIDDYASKAGKKSLIQKGRGKVRSMKNAMPTIGHRSMVELWRQGYLQNWIQQNHDGLPQKAGFPQECINEIHGGWFDPSNPVVPMKGSLRTDLCDWLHTATEESDLCMAVGTSMCGMTADDVFVQTCGRFNVFSKGQGGIIIGLQQTQYDRVARLRIYSRIDEVMSLLMEELGYNIPPCGPYKPNVPPEAVVKPLCYRVPYDKEGNLTSNKSEMIVWNLNPDTEHIVTNGPGKGFVGTIRNIEKGHFKVVLPIQRQKSKEFGTGQRAYTLGSWWIETAVHGRWPKLPIVNSNPQLQSQLPK